MPYPIYVVDGVDYNRFTDLNDALDCIKEQFYSRRTNSCTIDIEYVSDDEYHKMEDEEQES
jgi:hypothetical protein